jgi:Gas vesicle protein
VTDLEPRGPSGGEVRPGSPGTSDWAPVPEADSEGALARLLDVLLDKGVYLDLDLVITVADVPLIAVNLRATIAGVETMLEWGVPGVWDEGRTQRTPSTSPRSAMAPAAAPRPSDASADDGTELPAAMLETRAGSAVWREGTLLVHEDGTVRWRGSGDRRPGLSFDVRDLDDTPVLEEETPSAGRVVALSVRGRSERIASPRADAVVSLLAERRRGTMGQGRVP